MSTRLHVHKRTRVSCVGVLECMCGKAKRKSFFENRLEGLETPSVSYHSHSALHVPRTCTSSWGHCQLHAPLLGGPAGTKFLSLVCTLRAKRGYRSRSPVVAARHPLLDGDTHQVLLCVAVKEWMRSGKHSERERYPEFIPDFSVFHCGASVARVKC